MKSPLKLDEEEVNILQDFERGEFTSLTNFKQEKRRRTRFPSEGQNRLISSRT